MIISYFKIIGCDFCGCQEVAEGYTVCQRCLDKQKVRLRKQRQEAIAAFTANHPGEPLPDCFKNPVI